MRQFLVIPNGDEVSSWYSEYLLQCNTLIKSLRLVANATYCSSAMGLHGGKTGAKALFIETFAGAFQDVTRLRDVRELVGV